MGNIINYRYISYLHLKYSFIGTMKHYLVFFILLITVCCSSNNSHDKDKGQSKTVQNPTKLFKLPVIPSTLQTPEARGNYLSEHYWDNFNFADTSSIHRPEIGEQAWVDYIDFLKTAPVPTAQKSISKFFKKAEANKKVYDYFTKMADKYLYDPNSPMRNEELYISVLDAMLNSPLLSDIEKIRPQERRKMAEKNRIGKPATNFRYTLTSGKNKALYEIKSEYTILFINNPGCHACEETIEALKGSAVITRNINMGKLIILSVYPDEDLAEWQRHLDAFPKEWICGYDKKLSIRNKNLYDLKAIPTLYLLDQNKTVLLKDATVNEIEMVLAQGH